MNKYIFCDSNNGHCYGYTLFESGSDISNEWHLSNIIKVYDLKGAISHSNRIPYGSHYLRVGESFNCFKSDCEKSDVDIKFLEEFDKIPEEYLGLDVIYGISGNY
jgi:hypothetical protein